MKMRKSAIIDAFSIINLDPVDTAPAQVWIRKKNISDQPPVTVFLLIFF